MSDRNESPAGLSKRGLALLVACAVLTVAGLVALLRNAFPLGVPGEWMWDYNWTGREGEIAWPVAAFVVFIACVWAVARKLRDSPPSRGARVLMVAALVVLSLGLQVGIAHLGKIGIADFPVVTLAPWSNGYFILGSKVGDMGEFLSTYHDRMQTMGPHVRTHPPGGIVLYGAICELFRERPGLTRGLLDALRGAPFDPGPPMAALEARFQTNIPGWVQAGAWSASMLLMVACCLAVAPIFALARRLHGDRVAFVAAALTAALPGLLVFTPATDQLFCPIAALVAWLCVVGVDRGRVWPWAVAGLIFAAGLFVSLSVLPLLALVGGYALLRQWREPKPRGWRVLLAQCAVFAAVVAAFFIGLRIATGFRPLLVYGKLLRIAPQTVRDAYDARAAIMTYRKWIWWNLADVLLFAGLSLCVFYVAAWARRSAAVRRGPSLHFHLAFLVMLLLLNFSGVTLGEVGRLWLQCMPFLAILAAAELVELAGAREWPLALVLALQGAIAIVMKLRMSWF